MPSLRRFAFFQTVIAFALLLFAAGASGYLLVTRPAINQFAKWIASDLIPKEGNCQIDLLSQEIARIKSKGLGSIQFEHGQVATASNETSTPLFPFDSLLAEQIRQRSQTPTIVKSTLSETEISFACGTEQVTLHFGRTETLGALPDKALLFWIIGLISGAIGMAAVLAKSLSIPLAKLAEHLRSTPLGADAPASQTASIREFDLLAQEIDDLRSRASSAVASRSALLMSLSHDLRKPLTRIRLILDTETRLDEATIKEMRQDILELQDALDEFMRAANAMASPSQPDGAQLAWTHLKRIYTDPRLSFSGHPDASCPPVNSTALIRIGTNLIDNALQHTDGDVIVTWDCGQNWKICINDNGPGIDHRYISQDMHPFRSSLAHAETSSFHAGLGLSLVKILCEHNGWKVETGKTPDGLCYVCVLPLN